MVASSAGRGHPDVGQVEFSGFPGDTSCGWSFCWVRRSLMPDAWSLMAAGLRGSLGPVALQVLPLSPLPPPPGPRAWAAARRSRSGLPAFPVTWVPELCSPAALSSTKPPPLLSPTPTSPSPDISDVSLRGGIQILYPGETIQTRATPPLSVSFLP